MRVPGSPDGCMARGSSACCLAHPVGYYTTMRNRWLWAILITGGLLRAALLASAWQTTNAFTPDSWHYLALSDSVADGGRFATDSSTEVFRTPGYPLALLVRHVAAWGGRDDAIAGWQAVAILQIIADLLLAAMVFALGRQWFSQRVGLLAAGLYAISPLAIGSSVRMLSDTLFALLLMVCIYQLARHLRQARLAVLRIEGAAGENWQSLVMAAVAMASGCYIRPIGLTLAGVIVVVLLFCRRGVVRAVLFAGVIGACVAPWVVRNALSADYAGFSSFAGESAYMFSAPRVAAAQEGISVEQARAEMDRRLSKAIGDSPAPGQKARYRGEAARDIILKDPGTYMRIHLKGAAAFWLPGAPEVLETAGLVRPQRGTLEVLHSEGLLAAVWHYFGGSTAAIVLAAPMVLIHLLEMTGLLLLAAGGLRHAMMTFARMRAESWIMLLLAAVCALAAGPAAHPRFRVPVEPMFCIAAAAGWMKLISRKSSS